MTLHTVGKGLPDNLSGIQHNTTLNDSVSSLALERANGNAIIAEEIDTFRDHINSTLAA